MAKKLVTVVVIVFAVCLFFFIRDGQAEMRAVRKLDTKLTDLVGKMKSDFRDGIGCTLLAYRPKLIVLDEPLTQSMIAQNSPALVRQYEQANLEYAQAIEADFNKYSHLFGELERLPDPLYVQAGFYRGEWHKLTDQMKSNVSLWPTTTSQVLSCSQRRKVVGSICHGRVPTLAVRLLAYV